MEIAAFESFVKELFPDGLPPFRPGFAHNERLDCLEYFFEDTSYWEEQLDDDMFVYNAMYGEERVVGFRFECASLFFPPALIKMLCSKNPA